MTKLKKPDQKAERREGRATRKAERQQRQEQRERTRHSFNGIDTRHLISDGDLKRCSVCKYPFPPDVKPSVDVAFSEHLRKAHKPGQTTEDASQAAFRVVQEATKD